MPTLSLLKPPEQLTHLLLQQYKECSTTKPFKRASTFSVSHLIPKNLRLFFSCSAELLRYQIGWQLPSLPYRVYNLNEKPNLSCLSGRLRTLNSGLGCFPLDSGPLHPKSN